MGLLDKFFKSKKPAPKAPAEPRTRAPAPASKTAKELATEKGEPYVAIINMDIDSDNLHQGSFELDWNDKFITNLIRAGYQMKPDESENVIIDRWFQNVCRHVVLETWEQEEAMNPQRFTKSVNLGGGFSEVS
jgi:hypothetical protein